MMRPPWQLNATVAVLCAGIGVGDGLFGPHWGVPLMAAAGGVNVFLGRQNYRRGHRPPPAHHPDYAKIARLEIELGLVEPPPPPPPPPPVNPTIYDGGVSVIRTMINPGQLRRPDHPCSLCIPGRPWKGCPFNSVCQT